MNEIPTELEVSDVAAKNLFRNLALDRGLDPDSLWVGGYVAYEWAHIRHIFQAYNLDIKGKHILEFGCNFGASAIVLAKLGAQVTAIDIDDGVVELAKANAAMYGLQDRIRFLHVRDTTSMPFDAALFDITNCNSVLEYVPPPLLSSVQHEIDRVLKPNGLIFISGTSNRLCPVEMHSRKWLVNYVPGFFDKILFNDKSIEKGVFPWDIRYGFGQYENVDWANGGCSFIEAKRRIGGPACKLLVLKTINAITRPIGIWMGLILPSLTLTLRKLDHPGSTTRAPPLLSNTISPE